MAVMAVLTSLLVLFGALGGMSGGEGGGGVAHAYDLVARDEIKDTCEIVCKPTVCTADVTMNSTPTRLVYLCKETTFSTPSLPVPTTSTKVKSTVMVTVTEVVTVEPSSPVVMTEAWSETGGDAVTVFQTLTVYRATKSLTDEEPTTTTTLHSTSTVFKTVTMTVPKSLSTPLTSVSIKTPTSLSLFPTLSLVTGTDGTVTNGVYYTGHSGSTAIDPTGTNPFITLTNPTSPAGVTGYHLNINPVLAARDLGTTPSSSSQQAEITPPSPISSSLGYTNLTKNITAAVSYNVTTVYVTEYVSEHDTTTVDITHVLTATPTPNNTTRRPVGSATEAYPGAVTEPLGKKNDASGRLPGAMAGFGGENTAIDGAARAFGIALLIFGMAAVVRY